MTHSYETWLIYTWHDSFQLVLGACDEVWEVTLSCETWLVSAWRDSIIKDMTRLCVTQLVSARLRCLWWGVWHDSFIRDMTHLCLTCVNRKRHDSFMRDMTHSSHSILGACDKEFDIWMSHAMKSDIWMSRVTLCSIWLSHVTECDIYRSHVTICCVWHTKESCLLWLIRVTYKGVMSLTIASCHARMSVSYKKVMSRSSADHINNRSALYVTLWDMTHLYVTLCDVTHLYVRLCDNRVTICCRSH